MNTVSANATVDNVNTRTLEKYLNIPLEKFINDQFSSLPKDFKARITRKEEEFTKRNWKRKE